MKQKSFIHLLCALLFSTLGDGLTLIAIPWLSSSLTESAFLISLVTASMSLPWLLFSLQVGLMIDKHDKKSLMMISIYSRIALLLFLILLITMQWISIPWLITFGFLLGCSKVVFDSTSQTLTPEVVAADQLEKANGLITTIRLTMSDVLGRAIGGLVIAISIITPFTMDTLFLILAGYFVLKLKLKPVSHNIHRQPIHLKEGIRFVLHENHLLLTMIILGSVVTFLFSSTLATQILLMREVLHLSSFGFGLIISISTIGSLLASNTISLLNRINVKNRMILSILAMGITFGGVGLANHSIIVALLYFVGSYFIVVWNIATVSYRQRITPQLLMGRVGGIVRLFSQGIAPIGMLFGGGMTTILSQHISRDLAIKMPNILLGLVLVVISLFLFILFRNPRFDEKNDSTSIQET